MFRHLPQQRFTNFRLAMTDLSKYLRFLAITIKYIILMVAIFGGKPLFNQTAFYFICF